MEVFCSFFVLWSIHFLPLWHKLKCLLFCFFFFNTNLKQFLVKKIKNKNGGEGRICLSLRRARHSELILKLYPSLSLSYRGGTFMSRPRDCIFKDLCSCPVQAHCGAMAEKCNSKRLKRGPFCLFQVTTSTETKESQFAQNQRWGSRVTLHKIHSLALEKWKLSMAELHSDYTYCLETRNSRIKIGNWFMLQTRRNKNHPPFRLHMTFRAWDVRILTSDIPNQLLVNLPWAAVHMKVVFFKLKRIAFGAVEHQMQSIEIREKKSRFMLIRTENAFA